MIESKEFLKSLEHNNPSRPKFTISSGDVNIFFNGNNITIPMGELLSFAHRWREDFKSCAKAASKSGRLAMYPYALTNMRPDDPDVDVFQSKWD